MKPPVFDQVVVTVPIPGKPTSPNWRGHWAVKAKATSQARDKAHLAALDALGLPDELTDMETRHKKRVLRGKHPRWRAATVWVTYHFHRKCRRDADNLMAKLKGVMDGIVDAGVLEDDDKLTWRPITICYDKTAPERVEIAIEGNDDTSADGLPALRPAIRGGSRGGER